MRAGAFSLSLPLLAASALAFGGGCEALDGGCGKKASAERPAAPGEPVERLPPNGSDQKPAFPGQTRAPFAPSGVALAVRTVTRGLEHPWALAFLPDGRMLVTERRGRMRLVAPDGTKGEPLAGLPTVDARDQGGLLDLVVLPRDGELRVFFSFAEPREGGNGTAVGRARLVLDGTPRLEDPKVVWRQTPTIASTKHFGSRIVVAPDDTLWVTLGERSNDATRGQARDPRSGLGKVVRITQEGAPAPGNPALGPGALPEIWSLGHRNLQGAALHPRTKELWTVEHGPRGGDEINVPRAGKDHGWPKVTYGIDYKGGPIGEGITRADGIVQPVYYWDPSIAPSGMTFYDADLVPAWKGNLFVGALAGAHLARLVLDGEKVVGEERLVTDHGRIRDVRVGPNGALFLLTDATDGELLEVKPR